MRTFGGHRGGVLASVYGSLGSEVLMFRLRYCLGLGVRVLLGYGCRTLDNVTTAVTVVLKHDYMQTIQRDTVAEMGLEAGVGKKEKLENERNNFGNNNTSDSKPSGGVPGRKIGRLGLWTAG